MLVGVFPNACRSLFRNRSDPVAPKALAGEQSKSGFELSVGIVPTRAFQACPFEPLAKPGNRAKEKAEPFRIRPLSSGERVLRTGVQDGPRSSKYMPVSPVKFGLAGGCSPGESKAFRGHPEIYVGYNGG